MNENNGLPPDFLKRLTTILSPPNLTNYLDSLSQEKFTAFRINTLKARRLDVLNQLTQDGLIVKPISWCSNGFYITSEERQRLTASHLVEQGSIYIQNPASLFASLVLSPKSHEEILDLAAAPGGKALHLAALMENKGRIAAVEAVKNRFFRLVTNINRADAEIIKPYLKDGSQIGRLVPERFDRVLLDAPCSSEGRFDLKDPATYAYWSEKKVKEMSHKQKRLIYSAIQALKPQGILVYCTCAFSVEENESIIQYALNKFAGKLTILPIEVPFTNYQPGLTSWGQFVFDANMQHAIRIVPDQLMNGFFICKLQKVNSTI